MSLLRRLGLASIPGTTVLDATSLEVVAELKAGGWRGHIAAGLGAVWITTWDDKLLSRFDPATRTETQRVKLPKRPYYVTVDEHGPVAICDNEVVVRVDPAGTAIVAQAKLPEGASEIAAADGTLWTLRTSSSEIPFPVSLLQLDPGSLEPVREVPLGKSLITGGLRAADGVVAVLVEDPPGEMSNAVLDIATGERLPAERAPQKKGVAEQDGIRWLRDGKRGYKRVEIASGRTLATGEVSAPEHGSATLVEGALWVCTYRRPTGGTPANQN